MAYSSSNTKLSINRWGELMGVDSYTLNGVSVGDCEQYRLQPNCEKVWTQYRWQSNTNATREQLGDAIQTAVDDIEWKLSYPVAPTFIENETILFRDSEANAIAKLQSVVFFTDEKKLISAGHVSETELELSSSTPHVYENESGYWLTFFLGITSTIIEETMLADSWEIWLAPQEVDSTREQRWKMPKSKLVALEETPGDGKERNIFIKYWYPTQDLIDHQLILAFPGEDGYYAPDICTEPIDSAYVAISTIPVQDDLDRPAARIYFRESASDCTENCKETILPGIVEIVDAEEGLIALTLAKEVWTDDITPVFVGYECATEIDCSLYGVPYKVEFDYKAGATAKNGEVFMETEIAKMAAARLPMEVCECGNYGIANTYRDDYALYDKASPRRTTVQLLNNPFGTRRGEVESWMAIQKYIGSIQYAGLI